MIPSTNFAFQKIAIAVALIGNFALSTTATAQARSSGSSTRLQVPTPGDLDSRIRQYAYHMGVVFELPVTVGMHTHIQMGEDEVLIEKPRMGETVQWRVSGNSKNIYIKALTPGVSTSMTLVTDRRTYQFDLRATQNASERVQMAHFTYPDDDERFMLDTDRREAEKKSKLDAEKVAEASEAARKKSTELSDQPVSPSQLSFYRVEAKEPWSRIQAYDDGRRTWVRMPLGTQDLPAIFMVDEKGLLMPVNYTITERKTPTERDVLVVERVSPQWSLRIGRAVDVRLFKD